MRAPTKRLWIVWALGVLLAMLAVAALQAQESICRYDVTAVGRYYRVMSVTPATDSVPADTVEISQHVQEREAVLRAAEEKSLNPDHLVYVNPDFILRIDCPTGWTSVAIDSLVVFPDSVHMVYIPQDTDTSWTTLAFWEGELVEEVAGNQYQFSALLFHGDSIVACGGNCPADPGELLQVDFRSAERMMRDLRRARLWGLVLDSIQETA